jgi:hypothetical protein
MVKLLVETINILGNTLGDDLTNQIKDGANSIIKNRLIN